MKCKKLIIWLMTSFPLIGLGQTGLLPGGGDHGNEYGGISFSIGQVFYQEESQSNIIVLPGVQQTFLNQTTSVDGWTNSQIRMTVYPNPANDYLLIEMKEAGVQKFHYQLYNLNGQSIIEGQSDESTKEISIHHLPSSSYLLKVTANQTETKTFQIIKR